MTLNRMNRILSEKWERNMDNSVRGNIMRRLEDRSRWM